MKHAFIALTLIASLSVVAAPATTAPTYASRAAEVMAHFQKTFYDADRGVYVKSATDRTPDYVWREAAAFSALVAAARHEPGTYRPLLGRFFKALDVYWDTKAPIPAYEPAPTRGNGHDKYYDDNAWLVITFLEAYELTNDRAYFDRAREVAKFVLSGSDDQLGGGIWWHASHKDDSKNTCACGPGAVGFVRLAELGPKDEAGPWIAAARKTVEWTTAKLQAPDGLFDDRIIVSTGEVKRGKLTYNSALMLRANLALYRQSHEAKYLDEAKRIGKAAEWFLDKKRGTYRDPLKWSHFMVEADLDLYRETHDPALLQRARGATDGYFAAWQKEPPGDMMSNADLARMLYLMAEVDSK